MRVAVVAEFYPRAADPVLGIWAHRQSVAVSDAGADVCVFVLHRLVPPAADFSPRRLRALVGQPAVEERDGLTVHYIRYVSPPRTPAYARWGRWAAPALARALRRAGEFDLIHAHNAVPAGDAVLRAVRPKPGRPAGPRVVVSVHGGDVLWTRSRAPGGEEAVRRTLAAARLVLVNSRGIDVLARAAGARQTRVVRLGTDLPDLPATTGVRGVPGHPGPAVDGSQPARPLLVTVGHLVARKRHADVIEALARIPGADYLVIGDGPERPRLAALAGRLGVAGRVEFAGALPPDVALRRARTAQLFVMPSTSEAFGVAYIEAMAAAIPAIAAAGEPGPEEIGPGIVLVPPRDPPALAAEIDRLLRDQPALAALGAAARQNIAENFTWDRCGTRTLAAYEDALS